MKRNKFRKSHAPQRPANGAANTQRPASAHPHPNPVPVGTRIEVHPRQMRLADAVVLTNESKDAFLYMLHEFITRFQPADAVEEYAIHDMVASKWQQLRFMSLQNAALDVQMAKRQTKFSNTFETAPETYRTLDALTIEANESKTLALITRYYNMYGRSYDKALSHLRSLQADRPRNTPVAPAPPQPPPPQPETAHNEPKPAAEPGPQEPEPITPEFPNEPNPNNEQYSPSVECPIGYDDAESYARAGQRCACGKYHRPRS